MPRSARPTSTPPRRRTWGVNQHHHEVGHKQPYGPTRFRRKERFDSRASRQDESPAQSESFGGSKRGPLRTTEVLLPIRGSVRRRRRPTDYVPRRGADGRLSGGDAHFDPRCRADGIGGNVIPATDRFQSRCGAPALPLPNASGLANTLAGHRPRTQGHRYSDFTSTTA